jgi:hypothetical protein
MSVDRDATTRSRTAGPSSRRAGPTPAAGTRQLHVYLDVLAGDEPAGALLEVRTRRPGRVEMRSWFVDVGARRRLLTLLPAIGARADVYVGVAPRRTDCGTREAITHAHVAWADVDGPDGAARLAGFGPPPSLVIASGTPGSVHGYWALSRPADVIVLERINTLLAAALGGDPLWAATTILRPPATLNHKHDLPRPVELVERRGALYDPDQLLAALTALVPNAAAPPARGVVAAREANGDRLLMLSARVYVARLLGVEVPRSGFVPCPWHEDRTPSLRCYEAPERGWYCYSRRCRRGGSIYDFAARLWGVGTRNDDFLALRARLLKLFPAAR